MEVKRVLRPSKGPQTDYNILVDKPHGVLAEYSGKKVVKAERVELHNNSDNMKKSLEQPFVSFSAKKGCVSDPKAIMSTSPQTIKGAVSSDDQKTVHVKGKIVNSGGKSFYVS